MSKRKLLLILMILVVGGFQFVRPAFSAPSDKPDFDRLDAFVEEQMRRHRIPGLAVGITRGSEIVHLRGFGETGNGEKVTPQTPFFIGSVTKSFTALAVMQLVEEGSIELDEPVQTYLPWFRVADKEASQTITVRHLLNQTSGLSNGGHQQIFLPPNATLEDSVRDLADAELTAPVGSTFQYFNLNYNVLGLIVEYVSGQDFGAYIQEHIFTPLDMGNSYVTIQDAKSGGLAQGHNVFLGFPIQQRQPFYPYDLPAGFIMSSAEDMSHYLIAQNNDGVYKNTQILSPASTAVMHQPVDDINNTYAMGWDAVEQKGVDILEHNGAVQTSLANVTLLPEQGYGVVILMNQNSIGHMAIALDQISSGVTDLLVGNQASGGISLRLLYGVVTAVILLDLGRHVRNILLLSGREKEIRRKWWAYGQTALSLLLLIGIPVLLIHQMGRQGAEILLFSYMPGITAWIALSVLLSLMEAVMKIKIITAKSQTTPLSN